MYKIIIGLQDVAQTKSLAEACQMFIQKIKEMIKSEGCSVHVIYESCMIETEIDGTKCLMNFTAIKDFSHAIGIIKEDGALVNKPVPYIPKEIAREIFASAHNNSLEAYLTEHTETLARLLIEQTERKIHAPKPGIILTT